jgi:hypothetical protein
VVVASMVREKTILEYDPDDEISKIINEIWGEIKKIRFS